MNINLKVGPCGGESVSTSGRVFAVQWQYGLFVCFVVM